jgi:hypothetical protein
MRLATRELQSDRARPLRAGHEAVCETWAHSCVQLPPSVPPGTVKELTVCGVGVAIADDSSAT